MVQNPLDVEEVYVVDTTPTAFVVPDAGFTLPHAAPPRITKFTASLAMVTPPSLFATVATTVEVVVPVAGRLDGLAVSPTLLTGPTGD
jgi:hypothetical protein